MSAIPARRFPPCASASVPRDDYLCVANCSRLFAASQSRRRKKSFARRSPIDWNYAFNSPCARSLRFCAAQQFDGQLSAQRRANRTPENCSDRVVKIDDRMSARLTPLARQRSIGADRLGESGARANRDDAKRGRSANLTRRLASPLHRSAQCIAAFQAIHVFAKVCMYGEDDDQELCASRSVCVCSSGARAACPRRQSRSCASA